MLTVACGRPATQDLTQNAAGADLPDHVLADLAHLRIFFAHQSVGQNIIDALAELRETHGTTAFRLMDVSHVPTPAGPVFAHARLGQNGDPKSKTDAFVAALESGLGDSLDVAFQKYCFADIDANTDVADLFEYYRRAMADVRQRYPKLVLVHVTTPLMVVESGPKSVVKLWLGRMPDRYADNIAREQFNARLRREFGGSQPVFDLAALEASAGDGAPQPLHFRDQPVYALRSESASDTGHLNPRASRRVANALMVFLSHAARPGGASAKPVVP